MSRPHILLTNDDGIDADGLAALYEELTAVGDVTVVAPADDQSGVGRRRNGHTVRTDHPWGYAIDGTPADCVAYGLRGLETAVDVVVSGCNHGPNVGSYVLGRSGTYGAAEEAAYIGTPALAVSAYHDVDFFTHPAEEYDFGRPARVARRLLAGALDRDAFDAVDVLNVNVPVDVADPPLRVTRPMDDYDLHVEHRAVDDEEADDLDLEPNGGEVVALRDRMWPHAVGYENPFPGLEDPERYPVGTDRRALIDGEVSVSPLAVTASPRAVESAAVDALVAEVDDDGQE